MSEQKVFKSPVEKAAWQKAERMPRIHWETLVKSGISVTQSKQCIKRWLMLGWIELAEKEGHRKYYRLSGTAAMPKCLAKQCHSPEDTMWIVMNRYKTFTVKDLVAVGSVGEVTVHPHIARGYVKDLLKAGYLRTVQTGVSGRREAVYRLMKRTGEIAPVKRKVSGKLDVNERSFQGFVPESWL